MNAKVALLAGFLGLLLSISPVPAEEAKPVADPGSIAAARDLMEVTGVAKQLDGLISAMSQGFVFTIMSFPQPPNARLEDQQ